MNDEARHAELVSASLNKLDCHVENPSTAKAVPLPLYKGGNARNDETLLRNDEARHPAPDAGSINVDKIAYGKSAPILTFPHRGRNNRHAEFISASINQTDRSRVEHGMTDVLSHDNFLLTYLPTNLLTKKFAFTLAEVFHPAGKSRKFAFTLTEVLITLGIIGIVAVLTIPTLISNHQKQQTITKLKYVYSLMQQAFISSEVAHGDPTNWDFGTTYDAQNVEKVVKTYILPYISYQESGTLTQSRYYVRLKNGILLAFKLDGGVSQGLTPYCLYIKINLRNDKNALILSSPGAPMNAARYDFTLVYEKTNKKMHFFNWGGNTREDIKNNSMYACNKDNPAYQRFNCGALIQYDGWQIAPDYPW